MEFLSEAATAVRGAAKARRSLLAGATLAALCAAAMPADAAPASSAAQGEIGRQQVQAKDQAGRELARDEAAVREQASKDAPVRADQAILSVRGVDVRGAVRMTEASVRALLPELAGERVRVRRLSQQVQQANASGGVLLHVGFVPNGEGTYRAIVTVAEQKADHVSLRVANTGNDYAGAWRATASYINSNVTHAADTFGIAYVTSPDRHFSDVRQVALSYRRPLPAAGGALLAYFSYSDVDLGNVAPDAFSGLLDITASGKGTNFGLHYQHSLAYTLREKDFWDIGFDYHRLDNATGYYLSGTRSGFGMENAYDVKLASLAFYHNDRSDHHSFTWNIGLSTDIAGDEGDWRRATPSANTGFVLAKAGASYQVRTKGDWIFGARAQAQYTGDRIVASEQFGAGGQTSVRGFEERAIAADKGIAGSLELYTPEVAKHSRLLAFVDAAHLANNGAAAFDSQSLASCGIGYRYADRANGLSIAVDYAKILKDPDDALMSDRSGHMLWSVSVTQSF